MALRNHRISLRPHRGVPGISLPDSNLQVSTQCVGPFQTSIAKKASFSLSHCRPAIRAFPVGKHAATSGHSTYPDTARTADLSSQVSWSSSDSKVPTGRRPGSEFAAVAPGHASLLARLRLRTVSRVGHANVHFVANSRRQLRPRNEHATETGCEGAC